MPAALQRLAERDQQLAGLREVLGAVQAQLEASDEALGTGQLLGSAGADKATQRFECLKLEIYCVTLLGGQLIASGLGVGNTPGLATYNNR